MPSSGKIFSLLLIYFIIAYIPVWANEFDIKEVPPLHQLHLFQSEVNPEHFILVGKDGIYGDAGNWYVVDLNAGKVTSPKLKKDSFFWYSGGFDFKYENGQWLYIPTHDLQPGALLESIPAGLIDPNKGREPLKSVKVSRETLDQLKLSTMVALEAFEQMKKSDEAEARPRPVAKSDNVVLITVSYPQKDGDERNIVREIKTALQEDAEKAINVTEIWGSRRSDNSELMIWAFDTQAPAVVDWINKKLHKNPTVLRGSLDQPAIENPVKEMDAYHTLDSLSRVLHAAAIFKRLEAGPQTQTPDQADKLAADMHAYLRSLAYRYRQMTQTTYSLDYWENAAATKIKYIENFERPLQSLIARGHEILHRLNRPLAREVLFFGNEDGVTPALALLNRSINEGGETYFENWLTVMADRITWPERATPDQLAKRRGNNSSGGVLQEFAFMSVTLRDASSDDPGPVYFNERMNAWPLLVFGMADSPVFRSKLARFVVAMDKHAEIQRELLKTKYDNEVTGNQSLVRILQSMSYLGAAYANSTASDAKSFSSELYYRQMLQIVTELLSTARLTIKNPATYIALLDTAVSLQRQVQSTFGTLPQDRPLAEALILMQKAVQTRLMRTVYMKRDIENCEEALLPQ